MRIRKLEIPAYGLFTDFKPVDIPESPPVPFLEPGYRLYLPCLRMEKRGPQAPHLGMDHSRNVAHR